MKFPSNEQWLYLFNMLVSRWVNAGKQIDKYYPKNILCIKWDEIGDMATCTHVFSLLKKKFPKAMIHVITKKYSAGLLENHPAVYLVSTDLDAWNKKYDLVIELRGTWKTLWRTFRYYPRLRFDRGTIRIRQRGHQPHETVTNYNIIAPLLGNISNERPQLFPSEKNQKKVQQFLEQNNIHQYCVIHAGARSALRRWTDNGFAQLADWLQEEKKLKVVFAGIPEEEPQIAKITDKMKTGAMLFTQNFDLLDLAFLLQHASLFVGNESGPLHIADAMNTAIVGLYGPGVKDVFYPQNPKARVIHHILECNPCDQITCVHPENPCMHRITLEEVKSAVNELV